METKEKRTLEWLLLAAGAPGLATGSSEDDSSTMSRVVVDDVPAMVGGEVDEIPAPAS